MVAVLTEYKGNQLIELKQDDNDKYSFKFGVRKAKLVLEHIQQIQEFVVNNESE